MSAVVCLSSVRHQRAHGTLHLAFKRREEQTVLADLRQEGCLKARFPRPVTWTEAINLNTSGGVAGGDVLSTTVHLGEATKTTIAAQAAERFYRALPTDPPAHIRTRIDLAEGASAEWLPQETILYDQCALDRVLDIHLAPTGEFLGVEMLLFGRTAMGEHVVTARIRDTIRLHRGGTLLLHDAIRLSGDIAATLARPAIASGTRAIATILYAATDARDHLTPLRETWRPHPVEAGASAWNGLLLARILAPDGACLRAAIVAGLTLLRAGRPLPRVWNC